MKTERLNLTVRDLIKGFYDQKELGVTSMDGNLNIRPKYQREFVYKPEQQAKVIQTVYDQMPLSVIWFAKNPDGTYEVLDGQQRTLSICKYIMQAGDIKGGDGCGYSVKIQDEPMPFESLSTSDQEKILNYELLVMVFEGTEEEKLEWFKRINVSALVLTTQELRNACYTGTWLTDAKNIFSNKNGKAQTDIKINNKLFIIKPETEIRQKLLETVIRWKVDSLPADEKPVDKQTDLISWYMGKHRNDENANDLYLYFVDVIKWFKKQFPESTERWNSLILKLDLGTLYNKYHKEGILKDPEKIENRVEELMKDDEIQKQENIFEYVLADEPKTLISLLNLRTFTDAQKRTAFASLEKDPTDASKGKCNACNGFFRLSEMQGDHIKPWSLGGKTVMSNLQLLCSHCNKMYGKKY